MVSHAGVSPLTSSRSPIAGAWGRFVIIDENPLLRMALRSLIEGRSGVIAGEAPQLDTALAPASAAPNTIVIVDVLQTTCPGLDRLYDLRAAAPTARTIVYSSQATELYGARCLRAGAAAYVRKTADAPTIVSAIAAVLSGRSWLGEALAGPLDTCAVSSTLPSTPLSALSDRELEVLRFVVQGFSNAQIAKVLCRSVKTVETHRHRLCRKLGVSSTVELLRLALHYIDGLPALPASAAQLNGAIQR